MHCVEKYQRGELTEEVEDTGNNREHEAKIAALEREIGQLVMELDLLKKRRHCPAQKRCRSPLVHRIHRQGGMPVDYRLKLTQGVNFGRHSTIQGTGTGQEVADLIEGLQALRV